jgi:uncharacterized repeat protein (TIGR03803 family)
VFLSFAVVLVGFSLAMGQTTETTLHNFMGGTDGADPVADLLYVPGTGIIYGTTEKGGGSTACTKGCGTVFSIHPDGSSYSVLYSFAGGGTDGANPEAGLVMDVSGNLWGTTYNGGTHNLGTVYELSPIGGGMYSESFVFSFTGKNGSHPLARLVLDSSGNVYGTTYAGGTKGDGAVFELAVSGAETVLHSFSGPDGSHPRAGVVFDSGGRLWGTTSLGGESKLGTVFVLSRSGSVWSETFLYSFTGANGANPYGAVTLDASGNAYGTTKFGGSTCPIAAAGCGVVYELEPSGGGYTGSVIYPFAGSTDGALPADALTWTVDESGFSYLYGTASEGGDTIAGCATKGCGTAFELCSIGSSCGSSSPWAEYTLFDFTGRTTGRTPEAGILNFTPSGGLDPLTHRGRELHGGCTIVCVTTLSSGGSSGNGTLDELP